MSSNQLLREIKKESTFFRDELLKKNVEKITTITKFLKKSKKLLSKLKESLKHKNIKDFCKSNLTTLYYIHETLVGDMFKTYLSNAENMKELRSFNDKLFTSILGIRKPKIYFARLPTLVATEFCKGITFFKNNAGKDKIPFYHRDSSCGDISETAEQKFINSSNQNKTVFLKNCYIERYIYDIVYTEIIHRQNLEHRYELNKTERMYQDAYPQETIKVFVFFDHYLIEPNHLTIITENVRTGVSTTENYTKNKSMVHCKKIVSPGGTFTKIQTFEQEQPWLQSSR